MIKGQELDIWPSVIAWNPSGIFGTDKSGNDTLWSSTLFNVHFLKAFFLTFFSREGIVCFYYNHYAKLASFIRVLKKVALLHQNSNWRFSKYVFVMSWIWIFAFESWKFMRYFCPFATNLTCHDNPIFENFAIFVPFSC